MHALREDFPVEDDVMQLEPRVARIEGEVSQSNCRLAGVEVDIRELRKSMDQKLDKLDDRMRNLDAKLDARFERQDAIWERALEKLDARFEKLDARFEKLDNKIDRIDAKFESKLEALSTRRFTFWVTLLSSAATLGAAVLAILFSSSHGR